MTQQTDAGGRREQVPFVAEGAIALMKRHRKTWRNRGQAYWIFGLLEEVAELIGALLGIHEGPVDHELNQIAAICLNWMDMRYARMVAELPDDWDTALPPELGRAAPSEEKP